MSQTPGVGRGRVSFEDRMTARRLSVLPHDEIQAQDYFSADGGSVRDDISPSRAPLSIRIPPSQAKTEMAFTALQYLPMPVLVLSSAKLSCLPMRLWESSSVLTLVPTQRRPRMLATSCLGLSRAKCGVRRMFCTGPHWLNLGLTFYRTEVLCFWPGRTSWRRL